MIINKQTLDMFRKIPGIYKFHFIPNDKNYIGESIDLYDRIIDQYPQEMKGKETRPVINAILKYSWDNIEIELIDYGEHLRDRDTRLALETACIIEYNTLTKNKKGYNVCLIGNDNSGFHLGRKRPPETGRKISAAHLGKKASPEAKLHMSLARKGKCCGKDNYFWGKRFYRELNPNYGKHASEETRLKISIANKGRQSPNLGKPMSEEQKKKLSLANSGRKYSKEERIKREPRYTLMRKPVAQIDLKTHQIIKIWPSLKEAEVHFTGKKGCMIGAVCNKRPHRQSAYGFGWEFV